MTSHIDNDTIRRLQRQVDKFLRRFGFAPRELVVLDDNGRLAVADGTGTTVHVDNVNELFDVVWDWIRVHLDDKSRGR